MTAIGSESGRLRCRVAERAEDWESLRHSWNELLQLSPHHTPWQSWEFLSTWWRHLANRQQLRIFVVERNDRPCLILPLQISTWSWVPGFPIHMLEPIGSIMDVNRPRFALGPYDPSAYQCAFDEIWRRRRDWHLIRIDEKAEGDDELPLMRNFAAKNALVFRQSFSHLCPYLDLNQSWDNYLQSRSSKLRKNLRASRKRLESLGPTELRIFESTDDIDGGLAIVRDLHKRSWKHVKKIEHSKSDAYQRFYDAWIQSQAQLGRARVLALFSGSRPVAATIALLNGTTYHSAQIVHDAEYAHCSPGTLLESLELEGLMHEQRFTTFDFMGSFLNNKLRWTNTATPTSHVFLMRKNLRNAIIDGYYFYLKPWLKPKVLRLLEQRKTKL